MSISRDGRLHIVKSTNIRRHSYYLQAIHDMECLKLGFEDIYLYFFRKDINVVFNLLRLHYSFFHLGLPLKDLRKVLASCQVSDKKICVSWGLCRKREFDFYIPEEEHYRSTRLVRIADNDVALLHMLKKDNYYRLYNVMVSSNVPSNKLEKLVFYKSCLKCS
ncbi:uncharacterized protein LOC144553878 [Carex rostrata]